MRRGTQVFGPRKPPGISDVVGQGRERAIDLGPLDDPFRRLAGHFKATRTPRVADLPEVKSTVAPPLCFYL